jgi:hypothetical protein
MTSLTNPSDAPEGYRIRFRFRLVKSFHSDDFSKSIEIDGIVVTLKSEVIDQPLRDAKWVILGANGFDTEAAAQSFANRLKHAVQIASVCCRLGADCGKDMPTSGWGAMVKESYLEQGIILRDDVHGVDIFKYDPRVSYLKFTANVQVHASLENFLSNLIRFHPDVARLSTKATDILLLLNNVLINPQPVAQIVLAISTVEMLGQDREWTKEQRQLLDHFVVLAEESPLSQQEKTEISDAIRRGMYRIGLRQGVLALLSSIGLDSLKKEWDAVYNERSKLVHKIAPLPGVDYSELAHRTINICGKILLRLIEEEVKGVEAAGMTCYA